MAGSTDKLNIYKEMLKLDPKSRVFTLLAEELCDAGEWEAAAEVCRKGLRFHPEHFRSRVLLGWALMELGEINESGRILMEIYDEIRKNGIIFKLLSEFAAFSGDDGRAEEFTRIYEAFHGRECIPAGPEIVAGEPEAVREAMPEDVPTSEDLSVSEATPEDVPALEAMQEEIAERKFEAMERLEIILSSLAERVESRISATDVPLAILSDKDKDLIKQTILAEVMAIS
jgi:hypothetical protein